KALGALLGPEGYHFERIILPVEAGEAEPATEALLHLAEAKNADVVIHYGADVEGDNLKIAMTVLDHRLRKVYTNRAALHAPNAIGALNLVPIELIVGTLVLVIGYFVLRPRGKLIVKLSYDVQLGGGMFSLRIYKIRRRGMGLKGGSEQS